MREIKFRAWRNPFKKIKFGSEFVYGAKAFDFWNMSPDKYTLEQFTGLHDKNGKPIYEGDIVKCTAHGSNNVFVMQVAYSDVWAMFYVYSDSHKPRGLTVAYHDFEVIGNIHENKELLDEKV